MKFKFISCCYLLLMCYWFGISQTSASPTKEAYNQIQVVERDLTHYPRHKITHAANTQITIGDLHGNALKLLYFLLSNNIVDMSAHDYSQFVAIYFKQPRLVTSRDVNEFNIILRNIKVLKKNKLRFLGDDLCDRGMNDYYTLKIFQLLDIAKVPYEIALSNHGNFFLSALEKPEHDFSLNPYGQGKHEDIVQSMLNMQIFIDRELINKAYILSVIKNHYLSHLKFPVYSINTDLNEITVYSHAPIDIAIIKALAIDIGLEFDDTRLWSVKRSLNLMQNTLSQWVINGEFSQHYQQLNEQHKSDNTHSPIKDILWNRDYSILNRDAHNQNGSFAINYVHGHDSKANVFDLDTLLGKGKMNNTGPYAIHLTHE